MTNTNPLNNYFSTVLKLFHTGALVFLTPLLYAQVSISGKVTDHQQKPVVNCNVLLLQQKDSSLVKGTLSNEAGDFELKEIEENKYIISYSFIGYEIKYQSIALSKKATYAGVIKLSPVIQQLNTVTLVAIKPMFEQKIDRMVVNVKNSITSAGGTVLDVLQKSPGVMVNRQGGTISMSGKDGVQVMINGKLSYMPSSALLTMLDGLSANNVERIELITTPPAKYDAGGNAGYINIVLLQNPEKGFNGSYGITLAGFYGSAPAGNFDFNYRQKKSNLYGSYTISRRAQEQVAESYRKIIHQNKITETDIITTRDPSQFNNGIRMGYDYQVSKKTTIGVLASGYNNKWEMDAFNKSNTIVNNKPDTNIGIINQELNQWKHAMINLNLQHNLSAGGEISINADYLYYDNYNPTNYANNYYDGNGKFLFVQNINSSKKTIINILPLQLDFRKKINPKIEMETGLKAVISKFTNDVLVERQEQNTWKPDTEFTADYLLKENIAAAYASVSVNADAKNTLKAGLRYEYTTNNLGSEITKNIVDRKYGYLFPTVYWSHRLDENNSTNISYNRRINRPTFNNLAPFLIFIDPNTFIAGNAALQPAISDAVKIDYLLKRFFFSVGYTYEAFTIGNFQIDVNTANNKQYMTAQNLDFTKTLNASFSLPFTFTKWWSAQFNLVGNWQQVKASYLKDPISVSTVNFSISGYQNFTLPKNYAIELSGLYQSKGLFGIAEIYPFGMLNIAAQKKFNKQNTTIRFGVDDIFSSMKFRFNTDVPEQQFYTSGVFQLTRRIFKLTYTRNFGNKILKAKRARSTASDAEQGRVQQ